MSDLPVDRCQPKTEGEILFEQLIAEYARLTQALAEENRLATLTCREEEVESIYHQWAKARRRVEECREAYDEVVETFRYHEIADIVLQEA